MAHLLCVHVHIHCHWYRDLMIEIDYEEYHKLYSDHLMRDIDILPTFRIVEVEYYSRGLIKWFKSDKLQFNVSDLNVIDEPIRSMLIS